MSRSSQLQTPLDGSDPAEEQRITDILNSVRNLQSSSPTTQTEISARVETARNIISHLSRSPFMSWPDRHDDQIFILNELQNVAYHEADNGGVQDIAQWCLQQFLTMLNRQSESLEALTGRRPTARLAYHLFTLG